VWTQWLPEPELDAWMKFLKRVARGGQISVQVNAGGEKVRDQENLCGAPVDAPAGACENIGLGKLQEASLDDLGFTASGDPSGEIARIIVCGLVPTAMGDEKDGRSIR
jgi:hypothetical protein